MSRKSKGFTLIELLIVITIIGILAVAFLPSVLGAPAKARDVARKGHLNQVSNAIEAYVLDGNVYPAASDDKYMIRCLSNGITPVTSVLPYVQGGAFPRDPSDTKLPSLGGSHNRICAAGIYMYIKLDKSLSPAQNYALVAQMENPDNGNADKADVPIPDGPVTPFTGKDSGQFYVLVR